MGYVFDLNVYFSGTFIPRSFAMWSPVGSRVWLCRSYEGLAYSLVSHLGFVDFSVILAVCALVLSYSAMGYIHLRLGCSRVEVLPFFIISLFYLLRYRFRMQFAGLSMPWVITTPSLVALLFS